MTCGKVFAFLRAFKNKITRKHNNMSRENIDNVETEVKSDVENVNEEVDNKECTSEEACNNSNDTDNQSNDTQEETISEEEKLKKEIDELKDKFLRLSAEFDNYRKRTLKEKAELILNGGEKTIKSILPVVDDFERALENIEKSNEVESVKEGVSLIYKKLISTLEHNGVKEIEAIDKPLDTDNHEAIAVVPAPQEENKGKIIDCVQKGYKLNDKVIRHSKVVVAE